MGWNWVHLVLRPLFGLLYQPQMRDDEDWGAVGGMRIGRGNRSTRKKPAPVLWVFPEYVLLVVFLMITSVLAIFSLWFCSPSDLGRFFSLLILYTVGGTPWTGGKPIVRPLPTHRTTQTQNKRTQTSMPRVGFEPTTPMFKRAKIFYALEHAATVIGWPQTSHH
jgi:hypothetical protein